jgi:hypothetical protein
MTEEFRIFLASWRIFRSFNGIMPAVPGGLTHNVMILCCEWVLDLASFFRHCLCVSLGILTYAARCRVLQWSIACDAIVPLAHTEHLLWRSLVVRLIIARGKPLSLWSLDPNNNSFCSDQHFTQRDLESILIPVRQCWENRDQGFFKAFLQSCWAPAAFPLVNCSFANRVAASRPTASREVWSYLPEDGKMKVPVFSCKWLSLLPS